MLFYPKPYHYIFIILLSPLSLLYGTLMLIRRLLTPQKSFNIPIISVGNLVVGGVGKTPFTIALAKKYRDVTIISRGYGRESRGLIEVSRNGEILTSVNKSGDEAMLMAQSLPNASVIVCEDRVKAIEFAKNSKLIILDDGFNRVNIKKFDILLEPKEINNYFVLPSGGFREFAFTSVFADIVLKEEIDFKRKVTYENLTEKMILLTAISKPQRLDKYLPKGVISKTYLPDHSYFDLDFIKSELKKHNATSILTTTKDMVKMKDFDINISLIVLDVEIINLDWLKYHS